MLNDIIEKYKKDIAVIQNQKTVWQRISFFSFFITVVIISFWYWIYALQSRQVLILISTLLIITFIIWWYWTLKIIKKIIYHRVLEYNLILCIQQDLKDTRELFKESCSDSKV